MTIKKQEQFVDKLCVIEDMLYEIISDLSPYDELSQAWVTIFKRKNMEINKEKNMKRMSIENMKTDGSINGIKVINIETLLKK